jgi:type I restriction enzyme S subunit
MQASERLTEGLKDAGRLFASLMEGAFSGNLTAEWEAANADWIKAQIDLQERLPRLILLAFIRERLARAEKAARAAVLVTALMKYAFLLQMEGNGRRRYYQFVPYHYGPFAKEIYDDLERLKADGLVSLENDTEEDKTRLTLVDPSKAEAALADFPDDLKEDVTAILDAYGDLDHNALLKTVYEKYPAYAKKSRVHKKKKDSSGRSAKK